MHEAFQCNGCTGGCAAGKTGHRGEDEGGTLSRRWTRKQRLCFRWLYLAHNLCIMLSDNNVTYRWLRWRGSWPWRQR